VQIASYGGMRASISVVLSGIHRGLGVVAFDGDVVLQGLVGVVMGYVIKHKEILDQNSQPIT